MDKEKLYREYFPYALRKGYEFSTNNAEAHDFAQEAMAKFLDRIGNVDPETIPNFDPYCKRIILNRVIDLYRSYKESKSARVNTVNEASDIRDSYKVMDISSKETYQREAELKRLYGKVMKVIGDIPDSYKMTMFYYYVHGYKIREVAEILGVGQSTIKSYLCRGRNRVYERLKHSLKESERRYVYSISEE